MKNFKLHARTRRLLADKVTPVSVYLRLRDRFPGALLLESGDYRGSDNSFSYICCESMASFRVETETIVVSLPDGTRVKRAIQNRRDVQDALSEFIASFDVEGHAAGSGVLNGLFGYTSYDAIRYFEDIDLMQPAADGIEIPDMHYAVFRYILAINHFKSEMYLLENSCPQYTSPYSIEADDFVYLANHASFPEYPFRLGGEESSNFSDAEYMDVVTKCKAHIARGDIFQIVASRRFAQPFEGDDFNVYRALRSINPSPYLFYFDYGSFKIFGSSPEAQIVVRNHAATIYPIAGTYRRTLDEESDLQLAKKLLQDPKENAEHVMLVDLARNDLSKHCEGVAVEKFKEVQFYSHLIHLVSKVTGRMRADVSTISIVADTFPAGTLSGAPKYRAMELIDQYERGRRRFYGGALGFLGFNGDCLHAITIRTFLSKDCTLYCQAGGGVVNDSDPAGEMNEVKTKLSALRAAMKLAEEIR